MSNAIARRKLGPLEVSAVGLGCMGMSEFYGPADHAGNLAVLNHAIDVGANFLDTADMYGVGANERLLSELLKTRRKEVIVATKFGNVRGDKGEFLGINGRPEYVRSACDASLSRLGVDVIDLYYQHRVDPKVPIEETVGAMAELVKAGKVRYLGMSEASAATLTRAVAVHPIAALQTEYSLWTREVESDILPTCRKLNVGFVAYSPLGRGFLTGEIKQGSALPKSDWRRFLPRFEDANASINQRLVESIAKIAAERNCTPAQFALAWLLHQGKDIVPIPGTRRIQRLDENIAATRIELTANDLKRIDEVLTSAEVVGLRYPSASMASVNL